MGRRGRKGVMLAVVAGLSACAPAPDEKASGVRRRAMVMPGGPATRYQEAAVIGGTLDPMSIPKYQVPLVVPPAMPRTKVIADRKTKKTDYYELALRQFSQDILPPTMGKPTTIWSYGAVAFPGTFAEGGSFHYPAFTIEAKWRQPVRVSWRNELVKDPVDCFHTLGGPRVANSCEFLPHLLPVDEILHWANPRGECKTGMSRPDCSGVRSSPYDGPVPAVVHLHGAHTFEDSDGFPEAWFLPAASNIPSYVKFTTGSLYQTFASAAAARQGRPWQAGEAVFDYPNDMEPTTLWYHDHSLGMTRVNVYAGPVGFYLLRGGPGDEIADLRGNPAILPGPAPARGDSPGSEYFEIPVVIQDRSFNADGSLFYPANRDFFEGMDPGQLAALGIRFAPAAGSDVAPIWNPEVFGNTMVVNGRTWPYLDVKTVRYRFRLLNGSQSRFLYLKLVTATDPDDPATWQDVIGAVTQIGADGGLLPRPFAADHLLLGPAERADVIVDFNAITLPTGAGLYLVNIGPDEPFSGGAPGIDFAMAHPGTTGQVMQFRLVATNVPDHTTPPAELGLARHTPLPAPVYTRRITLNEEDSATETFCVDQTAGVPVPITERPCPDGVTRSVCSDGAAYSVVAGSACPEGASKVLVSEEEFGPAAALLGTLGPDGMGMPHRYGDATTETPAPGTTEVWEIYNFTADAHPIHIHVVQFEVIGRQLLAVDADGVAVQPATLLPTTFPPEPWETGLKDTVIAYPGQVTRVKARFDIEGLFLWHCHILEHEDNEMMRPYCVGTSAACEQKAQMTPH